LFENTELMTIQKDSKGLSFLYENLFGRALLKCLTAKWLTNLAGKYLDSRASRRLISRFARKNGIDFSQYEECEYPNFNEFFCRKIKPELRPIDFDSDHLISPSDGYLSVYKIEEGLIMPIKQSHYAVSDLIQDEKLASEFDGGHCLVFRLCVHHYHRYGFADSGRILDNKYISGKFHTVRPIALRNVPVFSENSREYTVIDSDNFGKMIQMEVGAMLVGKISNHNLDDFRRGDEKGCFLYGGSTIVLLLQKDKVVLPDWVYESASDCYEIPVKMGQCIGHRFEK